MKQLMGRFFSNKKRTSAVEIADGTKPNGDPKQEESIEMGNTNDASDTKNEKEL